MADEELDTLNQAIAGNDRVAIGRWFVERGFPQIGYDEVTVLLDYAWLVDKLGFALRVVRRKPIELEGAECGSVEGQRESSSSSGIEPSNSRAC